MIKFSNLSIGDMFNIIIGRYVKISDNEAICVMSGIHEIGKIQSFSDDTEVLPLYCMLQEWEN
jgi:hypothetical protein